MPAVQGVLGTAGAPALLGGAVPAVMPAAGAVVTMMAAVVVVVVATLVVGGGVVMVGVLGLLLVALLLEEALALALTLALLVGRAVALVGMVVAGAPAVGLLGPAGLPRPPLLAPGWFVKVLWVAGLRWWARRLAERGRAVHFRNALVAGGGAVDVAAAVCNAHTNGYHGDKQKTNTRLE